MKFAEWTVSVPAEITNDPIFMKSVLSNKKPIDLA